MSLEISIYVDIDSNSISLDLKTSAFPLDQYVLAVNKDNFLWDSDQISRFVISPWNCLPLKSFVNMLLIYTQYANFKSDENGKSDTPAYIYSSEFSIGAVSYTHLTLPTICSL